MPWWVWLVLLVWLVVFAALVIHNGGLSDWGG